jgi:hypothetical protein
MSRDEIDKLLRNKDLVSIYENIRNQALDGAITKLTIAKSMDNKLTNEEIEN